MKKLLGFILTISLVSNAVAQVDIHRDLASYTGRYDRWAQVLQKGRKEDHLRALDALYRYGAILFFKHVERHREEIAACTYQPSQELLDILKLAGVVELSSTMAHLRFTTPFKGLGLPSDLRKWSYEELFTIYRSLLTYFSDEEKGKQGVYKKVGRDVERRVAEEYRCRGLKACLQQLEKVYLSVGYASAMRDTVSLPPAPSSIDTTGADTTKREVPQPSDTTQIPRPDTLPEISLPDTSNLPDTTRQDTSQPLPQPSPDTTKVTTPGIPSIGVEGEEGGAKLEFFFPPPSTSSEGEEGGRTGRVKVPSTNHDSSKKAVIKNVKPTQPSQEEETVGDEQEERTERTTEETGEMRGDIPSIEDGGETGTTPPVQDTTSQRVGGEETKKIEERQKGTQREGGEKGTGGNSFIPTLGE